MNISYMFFLFTMSTFTCRMFCKREMWLFLTGTLLRWNFCAYEWGKVNGGYGCYYFANGGVVVDCCPPRSARGRNDEYGIALQFFLR
jgi:hypothetical protein